MAKTIREQITAKEALIVAAQAAIVELTAKLGSEVDSAAIVTGAGVTFDYGKGTTRRELSGVVTGVKAADPANPKSATLVRVAVGDGFAAQIVTIYTSNVKSVTPAA
jgi:hypothetical protein